MTSREENLVGVFVRMADTLVNDFDVDDLFHELVPGCTQLLEAVATGLLLADDDGSLRVAAVSNEATHVAPSRPSEEVQSPSWVKISSSSRQ